METSSISAPLFVHSMGDILESGPESIQQSSCVLVIDNCAGEGVTDTSVLLIDLELATRGLLACNSNEVCVAVPVSVS